MTDTATTETTTETTTTESTSTDTGEGQDLQAELEKWKNLARKHEERSKANANAAKELDQLRQQTMSEQEKAVEQAKAEGRAEALRETGAKLVTAKFEAVAAGRLTAEQIATLLEGLNLAAFLTEDGDVDADKVAKYVDGIAPPQQEETTTTATRRVDLGQGARGAGGGAGPNAALNGDPLLKDLKSKLGIS